MEVRYLRRPFPAATVEFLAHTLCGGPSHPQVASTKILAESEAPQRSCDFCPFRVCLLLACLLACLLPNLLGPPLTLKSYKTKTGSTSSVTLPYPYPIPIPLPLALTLALILTRIEYWDRAGGGRNIVEETSMTNQVHTGQWMRAAQKGLGMSCIHQFGHHN